MVELMALMNPALTRIVCTFDSAQQRPVFPIADSRSRLNDSTASMLSGLSNNYATEMRRISIENADLFGLPAPAPAPGYAPTHGYLYLVSKAPEGVPVFVASPRYAEVLNRGGTPTVTFADCQGGTYEGDIAIDTGGLTAGVRDSSIWPVLTRGKNNIFIVISPSLQNGRLLTEASFGNSRILAAIFAVAAQEQTALITRGSDVNGLIAAAVQDHLALSVSPGARAALGLPGARPMIAGTGFRPTPAEFHERWNPPDFAANSLVTYASARARLRNPGVSHPVRSSLGIRRPDLGFEPEMDRHDRIKHALRRHAAVTNDMALTADPPVDEVPPPLQLEVQADPKDLGIPVLPDAQSREVVAPGIALTTQQIVEGSAESALKHSRNDAATTRISEKKRIRLGVFDRPLFTTDRSRLRQLKRGIMKFFRMPHRDGQLVWPIFEAALRTHLDSWTSGKTLVDVVRSVEDSDDEWSDHFTRLFLKSQTVKKLGSRFGKAKAGQIVSTFPKQRVFEDAVWAKYVELRYAETMRPTTYIHNQPLTRMFSWYQRFWKRGANTATDYVAWDSSCDHVFAHFDSWLLRRAGVPVEYVNSYLDRKFNTRSYLGPMLPMQHSGDRWTYLFNTYRNAALTGAAFNCPEGTPAAFSGDDMILNGQWDFNDDFHPNQWLMEPKLERGERLEFCGFTFGDANPFVASAVLLHRGQIGLQSGRADASFWDSFDLAARYGSRNPLDGTLAAAVAISSEARRYFNLPPSKFPSPPAFDRPGLWRCRVA